MSWRQWFSELFSQPAKHQLAGYLGDANEQATANECYLTISIESLWITHVRKGLSKFYGAMYGGLEVGNEETGLVAFNTFDAVADAKELDADHLDRIVQGPYSLLKGAPYRGGGVDVSMGLFSIKSADLAAPYLNLLKSVSKFAGVPVLSQAEPLVNLLHEGASAITGGDSLEIGRKGVFNPVKLGYYIVMRTESDEVKISNLTYDAEERKAKCKNNNDLDIFPYFVLKFSASPERDHFWDLQDLKEPFQAMKEQFRKTPTDYAENLKALNHFQVAAELSPNLLPQHAKKLSEKIAQEYARFVTEPRRSGVETSKAMGGAKELTLQDFNPFK